MLQVASALILAPKGPRVLMALRRPGTKRGSQWELPGGKIEGTETPSQALVRELFEELGVGVRVDPTRLAVAEFSLEVDFTVSLYRCEIVLGTPQPLQATRLEWVDFTEAVTYRPLVPSSYVFYPQIRNLLLSHTDNVEDFT